MLHFVFLADNFYVDDFARFTFLDSKDKTAAVANSMTYLAKKGIVMGELKCVFILKLTEMKAYNVILKSYTLWVLFTERNTSLCPKICYPFTSLCAF